MFRTFLGFFVYAVLISLVLCGLAIGWVVHEFTKPGQVATQKQNFIVKRGIGANAIAHQLFAEDLIHDPFIFMIGVTATGHHTDLKAGEYAIESGMSQRDIMQLMVDGAVVERRVTIREGLTSFEVVRLLDNVENLSGEITETPPEGSLLPNTYDYSLDENRLNISARMHIAMLTAFTELCDVALPEPMGWDLLLKQECGSDPLKTVNDVLTLASIVEKETSVPKERAKVAGVFINRLKIEMPLQTDPTVIYAITKGEHKNDGKGPLGRRLLRKDLEYDSPYNTYKYPGLPPGPIANPGKASIEAVLNPEEHDYIYFVADGTGGHAFAKTLAEHNRNVAEWRKIRREQ